MNQSASRHHFAWVAILSSLPVTVFGLACRAQRPASKVQLPAQCTALVVERVGVDQDKLRAASLRLPEIIARQADTVFQLDSLDLNCDGETDYVAQIQPVGARRSNSRPTLVAFVSEGGALRRVLSSSSPVDGPEAVAVAADLTRSGKRDLVTIGSDEGGYVFRVFRWRGDDYIPVFVPSAYVLRQEAEWSEECLKKINPRVTTPGELVLLRETISPASTRGHGAKCDLPADTLRLVNDSLVPIH